MRRYFDCVGRDEKVVYPALANVFGPSGLVRTQIVATTMTSQTYNQATRGIRDSTRRERSEAMDGEES